MRIIFAAFFIVIICVIQIAIQTGLFVFCGYLLAHNLFWQAALAFFGGLIVNSILQLWANEK